MKVKFLLFIFFFLCFLPGSSPIQAFTVLRPTWSDIYDKKPEFAKGWKYIVLHHSGTSHGNAAAFDAYHKQMKWGGLCYHFVICNGNGGTNGKVEIGFRWKQQKIGTHVTTRSWYYSIFGIGICLVGDFNKNNPSEAQLNALTDLVAKLMKEYKIPLSHVIGHNQVVLNDIDWTRNELKVTFHPGKFEPTSCPGKLFALGEFKVRLKKKMGNDPLLDE